MARFRNLKLARSPLVITRGLSGPILRLSAEADRQRQLEKSINLKLARLPDDEVCKRRRLLADFCRLLLGSASGDISNIGSPKPNELPLALPGLSPRVRQTLDRLLAGDSEKQVASQLKLSRHTVHVYIKTLYRKLNVCSRGELLAKFVGADVKS